MIIHLTSVFMEKRDTFNYQRLKFTNSKISCPSVWLLYIHITCEVRRVATLETKMRCRVNVSETNGRSDMILTVSDEMSVNDTNYTKFNKVRHKLKQAQNTVN